MKIICIGRNYTEHIKELSNKKEETPTIFLKPETSLSPSNKSWKMPSFSQEIHHEIEVIISFSKDYKKNDSYLEVIESVGIGIDFTARDIQSSLKKGGLPWEKAKAFDNSAVVSMMTPFSKSIDLDNLSFSLLKNGEIVQEGNTSNMIFSIKEQLREVTTYFSIKKGDILFTGTPAGVGKIGKGDNFRGFFEGKKVLDLNIF